MTSTTTLKLVIMFYPSDRVRRQCLIGSKKSDRQHFNMSICKQTNAVCMCYLSVLGVHVRVVVVVVVDDQLNRIQ